MFLKLSRIASAMRLVRLVAALLLACGNLLAVPALPAVAAVAPAAQSAAALPARIAGMPLADETATPEPTATPLPRNGVIASSRVQVYETASSDNPIKTLLKNTPVQVFETVKSRIHIKAGDVEGWVSKSSVIVQ